MAWCRFLFHFVGTLSWLFSIVERMGFKKVLNKSKIISTLYCFLVVNFGWVLFRANDTLTGIRYITRMVMPWRHMDIGIEQGFYLDRKTIFVGICAVIGMGLLKIIVPKKIADKWKDSIIEAIYCILLLILCLASIASDTYNPFIYFQF